MRKIICNRIAFVMAMILIAVNVAIFSGDAQAADSDAGQKVVYQQYLDREDVRPYMVNKVAPTYQASAEVTVDDYGYLFGGWFTKVEVEGVPKFKAIKKVDQLNEAENYYAKFVPAYILSVKCQNDFGTTSATSKTVTRMVAGVDSTNYASVGFEVVGVTLDNAGNLTKVGSTTKTLLSQNEDKEMLLWEKLLVYRDKENYNKNTPKSVLGEAGKYFLGARLSFSNTNYARTSAIRPFWVTYDGVKVYGLTKYSHVVDGIDGYINIPINLKNENKVAAGMVEFDWSALKSAGYEYMGAECGKTFKTIKIKSDIIDGDKSIIRCFAATDIKNGIEDVASDDIFINLRFKQGTSATPKKFDGTFYHFAAHEEEFSNINEKIFRETMDNNVYKNTTAEYDVWNIQY